MSKANVIQVINQAVCISDGVVHQFRVRWAASKGDGQYVVVVEALPEYDEPKVIHLMCRASTPRNALVTLLNDALETSSRESLTCGG